MKKLVLTLVFAVSVFGLSNAAFAQKLVILYTGETHANLYPCHCPIEPFGGVARRATKIKQLRKDIPNLLLVDTGAFFAGGVQDETSQAPEVQKERTKAYFKTLNMMGYDALNIGNDEFNFGIDFLESEIRDSQIPFLSCNAKVKGRQEFVIKEVAGVKVGIIGATLLPQNAEAIQETSSSQGCIQDSVNKLKSQNVDLIVVLSHLGEDKDLELINNVKGIDILISGHILMGNDKFTKVGDTILLRPSWQARKLGLIEVDLKDKKIENFNVEQLPLGADVPDDAEIKALIPACFSNYDCAKPNFIGTCQNAGTKEARCAFEEIKRISLLVIKPKNCRTCFTDFALSNIRRILPSVEVKYADYEEASSKRLIESLKINMLPAYILEREVEKDRSFLRLKDFLESKDNYYVFKPNFTGVSYFAGRQFKKNELDLFVLLHDKQSSKVLQTLKAFKEKMGKKINLNLHFLVVEDPAKGFVSMAGLPEIEDAKRAVCVEKNYPAQVWDYLICRTRDIDSSWWDKCLVSLKMDAEKIKTCATGEEANTLLREKTKLTQELQVTDTPILLMDNQEVFGLTQQTPVEELEMLIGGKTVAKE